MAGARERGQLLYLIDEKPLLPSVDKPDRGSIGGGVGEMEHKNKKQKVFKPLATASHGERKI